MEAKIKSSKSSIESAFIKAESKKQLITIEVLNNIIRSIHHMQTIKIKKAAVLNVQRNYQLCLQENFFDKRLLMNIPYKLCVLSTPIVAY